MATNETSYVAPRNTNESDNCAEIAFLNKCGDRTENQMIEHGQMRWMKPEAPTFFEIYPTDGSLFGLPCYAKPSVRENAF